MRFGLAGTGFWARTTHAPALATTPGSTLAGVWGRDVRSAESLAADYGAAAFADAGWSVPTGKSGWSVPTGKSGWSVPTGKFGAFLDAVDAVAFAVPPHVQAPLAIRAAEAGKHLLLEKPIALSIDDADKLVAAVEAAGVASVVFFTLRFTTEIRAWLADEHARSGWSGSGWSGGVAVWLGSALQPDSPFNTPWRREKGGLWDLGPHVVSLLRACLGPVTSVSAVAGGLDVTHLVLRHEGGASSSATMTLSAPTPASGNSLFVWGEAGRSAMPATPFDPVDALRVATAELVAGATSGQLTHPCDVRFGREVVRVLAAAQAQLDASP
jgi:predicted dehydrogenase